MKPNSVIEAAIWAASVIVQEYVQHCCAQGTNCPTIIIDLQGANSKRKDPLPEAGQVKGDGQANARGTAEGGNR